MKNKTPQSTLDTIARYRERRANNGMVRVEVIVPKEHRQTILEKAAECRAKK